MGEANMGTDTRDLVAEVICDAITGKQRSGGITERDYLIADAVIRVILEAGEMREGPDLEAMIAKASIDGGATTTITFIVPVPGAVWTASVFGPGLDVEGFSGSAAGALEAALDAAAED